MRVSYVRVLSLFVVPGLVVAACSDAVIDNTPSTTSSSSSSGGGSGGNTSGSGGNAGGSGGTENPGGMGGSGGASLCDQACSHANMCGVPVCSILTINCNSGMDYTCISNCVLNASCMQINTLPSYPNADPALMACFDGCQTNDCSSCGIANCQAQGAACNANPSCQGWLSCVQGCSDAACAAQCTVNNPGAAPESTNLQACLCTSCASECGTLGACGAGGAGGMGGSGGAGGAGGN